MLYTLSWVGLAAAVVLFVVAVRRSDHRGALLAIGVGAAALIGLSTPDTSGVAAAGNLSRYSAQEVQAACHAKVREALVSPSTARWADDFYDTRPAWDASTGAWSWEFGVEASNALGARLASRWRCHVRDDSLITVEQVY